MMVRGREQNVTLHIARNGPNSEKIRDKRMATKPTVRKNQILVALLIDTRTDVEQTTVCLLFLHLTYAAVVVLQKHAV